MISLKNILIPTDLSEPSRKATLYAREFAKQFGAKLHLLFVVEEPAYYAPLGGYVPSREEWMAYANSGLANWISEDDAQGLSIVRVPVIGHPVTAITDYSKKHDIDLIVMGTHGRSAVKHLLMGSVAENVVRHSPCPVLTVRADQHDFVTQ